MGIDNLRCKIRLGSPLPSETAGNYPPQNQTTRKTPIAAASPRQASGNDLLRAGPAD